MQLTCISIRQPWAWLIMAGHKTCENRSWDTRYRGTLAIHASGSFDFSFLEFLDVPPPKSRTFCVKLKEHPHES